MMIRQNLAHNRALVLVIGLLLSGFAASLWPALPIYAVTINVTTSDDEANADGDCLLREAIIAANTDAAVSGCTAGSGADTINIPPGKYVFSLVGAEEEFAATGDLDIRRNVTLLGVGRSSTTIDANGLDRVFELWSVQVTISDLRSLLKSLRKPRVVDTLRGYVIQTLPK
jgi:CSLREA domain-containing protein